jgi:hypothetical protein
MEKKELIISLIKDDLVNDKLINGLIDIGLNPGHYFLNLSETIFKLMGYKDNMMTDEIFNHYLLLGQKAKHIDVARDSDQLQRLANEIYEELSALKVTGEYSR